MNKTWYNVYLNGNREQFETLEQAQSYLNNNSMITKSVYEYEVARDMWFEVSEDMTDLK